MMKVDIYIREANERDINFIKNSWMRSFANSMPHCSKSVYLKGQEKLINKLMSRCLCYVACSPEELYQIFGWIMFENLREIGVMHYLYVKKPYRRYGIATQLFSMIERDKKYPCVVTHTTRNYKYIKDKLNLTYNPYLLLGEPYGKS